MALATIVRKEFLGHVLTLRFVAGALFTLTLFVAAGLVLRSDYTDRVVAYRSSAATHREALTSAKTRGLPLLVDAKKGRAIGRMMDARYSAWSDC